MHLKPLCVLALSICCCAASANDDLKISGFARLIGGYLDTDQATFKGYDNELSFSPASLFAVQADYQAHDKLSFTGQLMARADDDQDSGVEWLYLTWEPLSAWQVKAGKLRTPFFALSDYTDVGFAYHWINPPQQVYNAYLFRTFEGIDVTWAYSGKGFDSTVEIYGGKDDGDFSNGAETIDYRARKFRGIIGKINLDKLEFRVSRSSGYVDFLLPDIDTFAATLQLAGFSASADSLRTEDLVDVRQVGLTYDNLHYFFRSEWMDIHADMRIAPKVESYYLSAGYIWSPMTLHLTYADSKMEAKVPEQEIPLGVSPPIDQLAFAYSQIFSRFSQDNLSSWTLGTRWDVKSNMAFKVEWTRLQGKPDQSSFFTVTNPTFDRKANLYLLGLEWVF